ncbi:hypothetical protein AY498_06140 [Corynebacterium ulcerans]|uniref:Multidrug resistance efflux transporter family protein n=2 Tax=Corynebacterium TaxID=1716 RepID=A0ABM5RPG3_9CORY|nr:MULTISPECIES: DMT family transporter [Corynebacterium]AIU29591.1 Hypothetical protein Cul210931_0224 [Corynebacterium ulcerans]AIU31818.1 Hypothetical protein CulFRC11_0219 [Corynebacterium ramonii FRC0011]AIU90834.1 Hypothetical protein Cul05146_0240 [Corynebacterium ulcerans]ESU59338.1 membrane protein [Corynebacterium ulcerans NCTC 12077]KKO86387.1 membrane protein [Corynebacterium ulcerans]
MYSTLLAMGFALASALTIAWGTVVRHRIAEEAPAEGSPFLQAIRRPAWWLGSFTALSGYGLQIIALGFGTLLVVQPILVLSLMFTLPLSARYDGRRMAIDEITWAGLLTVAVAVLVLLGNPSAGDPQPPLGRWLPALAIGFLVLFVLERFAQKQIRNEKALLLGIVTGGIYGYVAVLSKATVDVLTHGGFFALATTWQGYSLAAGAILGTVVQQYAFNAGALKNSLPAMTVTEPIVAFALGYAVLGEQFQVSGANWLWMALALIAMIVSTFALSRRGVGSS